MRKWIITAALGLGSVTLLLSGQGRERLHPLSPGDRGVKTGPAVGTKIPDFEAVDQHGRRRNFENLKGPKGLLLLFVRSAGW